MARYGRYSNQPQGMVQVVLRALENVTFDTIVCTGASGAVVAPAVAFLMKKNLLIVRKGDEQTHDGGLLYGCLGNSFVIIDDFIYTGETIARILEGLDSTRAIEKSTFKGVVTYSTTPDYPEAKSKCPTMLLRKTYTPGSFWKPWELEFLPKVSERYKEIGEKRYRPLLVDGVIGKEGCGRTSLKRPELPKYQVKTPGLSPIVPQKLTIDEFLSTFGLGDLVETQIPDESDGPSYWGIMKDGDRFAVVETFDPLRARDSCALNMERDVSLSDVEWFDSLADARKHVEDRIAKEEADYWEYR